MTAYTDFTSDFPARCLELLDRASGVASVNGLEITLLLMTASASLLVPFERLKPDTDHSSHPFGDNRRFGAAAEKLAELMKESFVGSVLCPDTESSWRLAKNVKSVDGDLDCWLPDVLLKPLNKQRAVKSTLTLVRNAFAHGSIYTIGDPIKELIFVKEVTVQHSDKTWKRIGFEVLSVSYGDFQRFIRAWVMFLGQPNVWELRLAA